jgi:hypothetical protein
MKPKINLSDHIYLMRTVDNEPEFVAEAIEVSKVEEFIKEINKLAGEKLSK